MLEHVAANQTRFVVPGLSADPRGVALGRWAVVLLPSLDRLVSFFRGLSARTSLDDLRHGLRITQVKTPLQSREFVVQLPVQSSFVADSVAGVAGLCRGLTFTGSAKHFVKYRDSRSPLGYDVSGLHAGAGDYIVYAEDFVQPYEVVRELDLRQLVLDLALVPRRDDRLLPDEEVLLRVVPGLWRPVVGYLRRNDVPCQVAVSQLSDGPGRGNKPEVAYLVRTRLPGRMVELFCTTPGIELLRLVAERAAVELGFAHPVELGSCSFLFSEGQFCLFSGSRAVVDRFDGEPVFVDGGSLVTLPHQSPPQQRRPTVTEPSGTVQIPLRLVATPQRRPEARAVRMVRQRASWLQRLVYLLPPRLLEGIRICTTDEQIVLTSDGPLELLPLGQPYYAAAPGVMVPVGWELLPRVAPEVLLAHLSEGTGAAGLIYFFEPGRSDPFALPRNAFVPMDRSVLARVVLHHQTPTTPSAPSADAPGLVNAPAGVFPLWGFSDDSGSD